jgi:hypothetical protein
MRAAGQMLEGYRAAPDKAQAFEVLAQTLVNDNKAKELEGLLQARAVAGADDVRDYYQGELYLLQGKFQEAERTFAAALAGLAAAQQYRQREGLFRARQRLGKIVETYREFGADFFDTLAYLCVNQKDAAALESLVAARRQERSDARLVIWDVEIRWLKEDYQAAWQLLSAQRQGIASQHRWQADDYLVRCLVKLQRFPEAVKEAERICAGRGNNALLVILAHAAAGDAPRAIAALEKAKRSPWLVRSCYQDNDLGPILKGDAFKEFRAQFPEPERESN